MVRTKKRRPDSAKPQPKGGSQAIRRALMILRILAAGRETGLPLREVVLATGLTRPTAHRIIQALVDEGIVEKNKSTGRYSIGQQVPELALARPSRSPLLIAAEPVLMQVSRQLGDTLFLTTRTGLDTLCIARQIGTYPIQILSIEVGARRPLGVSSAGVAILAAMSDDEARRIILANEPRLKGYRVTTAGALSQVASARRKGYSLRDVGLVAGTKSISAWIRGRNDEPIAALTLSAIRSRLGPRREAEIAETLNKAARTIEKSNSCSRIE